MSPRSTTPRGFESYDEFTDADGSRVRVVQSSAIGNSGTPGHSFLRIYCQDTTRQIPVGGTTVAAYEPLHLNRDQARRLRNAIDVWLDEVER